MANDMFLENVSIPKSAVRQKMFQAIVKAKSCGWAIWNEPTAMNGEDKESYKLLLPNREV